MKQKDIKEMNSVSLILSFKWALNNERFLLCLDIKNELISRKVCGDLNNEIVQATWEAYLCNANESENLLIQVYKDMLQDVLDTESQ